MSEKPASMANEIEITHNPLRNRFEAHVDGELSRLEYRLQDGVMDIHHTEVPASLGGRGIGGKLVEAAVAYARAHGLQVRASCSYAHHWMERHPASRDVMPPGVSRT
jgi:predicted GNAT family acetyltransferase